MQKRFLLCFSIIFSLFISPVFAEKFNFITPKDPKWPSKQEWQQLSSEVDGNLIEITPATKTATKEDLSNPYYITNQAGATQTSGWHGAWDTAPSAYGITAQETKHLVAAVNFAKKHDIRLVIKSGGHSYQGTSNAPDSLLVWMKDMNDIKINKKFVCQGCEGKEDPRKAVVIETGARWLPVYDKIMGNSNLYVQGGGCATVAVGGLISSGGFGSFSKMYGLAAAGLLEAEIVTADGKVLTVNPYQNSDLFWAIKGGGGGSFGIISKVTLRTQELPNYFGSANVTIKANSDESYKKLINSFLTFYKNDLMNEKWGESVMFKKDNSVAITMVFAGLSTEEAQNVWKEFLDKISAQSKEFTITERYFNAQPANRFFNIDYRLDKMSKSVASDTRENASKRNVFWKGNQGEVGIYLYGYDSFWLSQKLLEKKQMPNLVESIFKSTRSYDVGFHFNKGLAGSSQKVKDEALNTAMNPVVVDAFALAIIADGIGGYPKFTDPKFSKKQADINAKNLYKAAKELRKIAPNGGSYVSEADYFDTKWREKYWGSNYKKLRAVKEKYDPEGMFTVHHGVGSEKRLAK